MNSVILIGRLIKDPELRYTQTSSSSYARFTIAVDKGMSKDKKQELEAKGQQTADFINIVVWGKQAENCQRYLQKGRNVAIQGRLQSGSFTAQDGTKRFVTEVWAERVQFIDWGDKAQKSATPQGFGSFDTGMDDGFDLPFQDASDEEIPF
jgi:single-strand binding protein